MAAEAAEPSSSYTPVFGTSSETLLDSPTNSSLSDISLTLGSPPSSPSVSNGHLAGATLQQHPGPKFKLITEGDLQLCRLNHTRTIVSKIMNSKYLRRWESHHVILGENEIYSTTPLGFMEVPIPYSSIEEVNVVSRWDAGQKFCLRITVPDGSVLFQVRHRTCSKQTLCANNSYLRDQWMHSLQWKRHVLKYTKLLKNTRRPEVLLKEIKSMIDLSMSTPIQDENVSQFPLDLVSQLLQENEECISQVSHEQVIMALAPLLENNQPTQEICDFFSKHCKNSPRSQIVIELFTPVVHRILKHNTLNHSWSSMAVQGLIQSAPLKYIHKSVEEARALMEKVWEGMQRA